MEKTENHNHNIVENLQYISNKTGKGLAEVFSDMLMLSSCAIANSNKNEDTEKREGIYLDIVSKYDKNEELINKFSLCLTGIVLELQKDRKDILGEIYTKLNLRKSNMSQFFTPQHISRFMAEISLSDDEKLQLEKSKKGYISVKDPCCGSGTMLIEASEVLISKGISFYEMYMEGVDIDIDCVLMTYIQLSLLGIPAIIYQKNGLDLDKSNYISKWVTPMYYMFFLKNI